MNTELQNLWRRAEGRYFDDVDTGVLRDYANGMLANLATAAAIERAESAILDEVVARVMARFPMIPREHGGESEARVRRDQMLVLRYATHAMIAQDPDFIYDKLSVWLRTILVALCPPEIISYAYGVLLEATRQHLTEPDWLAIEPYLRVHVDEFATHGSKPQ